MIVRVRVPNCFDNKWAYEYPQVLIVKEFYSLSNLHHFCQQLWLHQVKQWASSGLLSNSCIITLQLLDHFVDLNILKLTCSTKIVTPYIESYRRDISANKHYICAYNTPSCFNAWLPAIICVIPRALSIFRRLGEGNLGVISMLVSNKTW